MKVKISPPRRFPMHDGRANNICSYSQEHTFQIEHKRQCWNWKPRRRRARPFELSRRVITMSQTLLDKSSKIVVQYSTVQYSTVQYSTVQYSTVQHSTVQHSTAQYSTVQHSTVQHSTVQYSTVQLEHKMSAPTIVQKLFKIDKLDPAPAPAPAVKTRPAAAPAPQQLT